MNAAIGDGSKTAILMFQELVEGGYTELQGGVVPRDLMHQMDVAIESAVHTIQAMSRKANGDDIASAARTAAAGDTQVGNMIAEALAKTGPNGVVTLAESSGATTSISVREGMYFDRGFLSTRFITDEGRQVAELSDAAILLYDSKIASMKQLLPILEQAAKANFPFLIIAEDVEGEALETLAINKERGMISCVAVRAPMVNESRQYLLEDIAVATGGTVISRFSLSLENVRLNQLGRARHVEVTSDSCWITGGAGDPQAVEDRAAGIRRQIELEKTDFGVERLQARLANLAGKVCAIRVGGASALDVAERMYKMTSALHSAAEAMKSGVAPGGGTALFRAGLGLKNDSKAAAVIATALAAPLRRQIANSRQNERDILTQMEATQSPWVGFDAETRRVVNLDQSGIVDPTGMCIKAVQLAFVDARAILETGVWDLTERTTAQLAK
jgi:chaperonin GroEL